MVDNSQVRENVAATFGGGLNNSGGIVMLDHSGILSNVLTMLGSTSQGGGVYSSGGAMTITNNSLIQNNATGNGAGAGAGIYVGNGAVTVDDSAFLFNGPGRGGAIYRGNGALDITDSCIVGNSDTAIDASQPVTATGNWWGHASGPSGAGPGVGDSVSSSVDFGGFLGTAILGCPTFADPDLAIAKTVTPTTGEPSGAITYTLNFSNTGQRFAHIIVISDSVPVSVTITGVTSNTFDSGVRITQTGGGPNFAWVVSDLGVGVRGVITLTGTITTNVAVNGTQITNTATITSSSDSAAGNNSATAVLTVTALCFAEYTGDSVTDFSSADAGAVRNAIAAASAGGTALLDSGTTQVALITKTLTLAGGYTTTNWTTPYPITQPTTLDALAGGRVIYATADATLQGFTVTNGYLSTEADVYGGGIFAAQALTLSEMTVYSNTIIGVNNIKYGGGAYVGGAAVVTATNFYSNRATVSGVGTGFGGGAYFNSPTRVTGATFSGNTTLVLGAGAYFHSTASVAGSTFYNNRGTSAFSSGGGASFNGAATVTGSTFVSNTVLNAGGGTLFAAAATVIDSVVERNYAENIGGGAYFAASADITGTSFLSNTAFNDGGGVLILGAAVITDTAFMNNLSGLRGGGAQFEGAAQVANSTYINNTSVSGGGAYFKTASAKQLMNVLFARNSAATNGAAIYVADASPLVLVHVTIASPALNLAHDGHPPDGWRGQRELQRVRQHHPVQRQRQQWRCVDYRHDELCRPGCRRLSPHRGVGSH
jgi:predicted outer membrane repeat protein